MHSQASEALPAAVELVGPPSDADVQAMTGSVVGKEAAPAAAAAAGAKKTAEKDQKKNKKSSRKGKGAR